ncbi:protein LONG AFTER FAR-RED 3 isoform X2 [Macadamia integrifolia]|uniref:protein LONG AFTER FAR-RED 3 isoform X2 n=1 Tax=Macadamia integrifolia TaxID=60698 RepID=UPI001C4EFADF|nr:protein LONG AFTER FAR-RED 3 isoform X2 [Macadamia integrifolia]
MNFLVLVSGFIASVLAIVWLPIVNTKWWSTLKSPLVADLVVKNGTIYTSDSSLPFAEAMAIRHGKILRVGSYSSLQDFISDGTKELNLKGKVVVPGFLDSHVHFMYGGLQMARVVLRGVNSKDEFVRKVNEAARDKKEGLWILGGGWNNELWGGELPAASWIDDVTPNNPVWLSRTDGHMGLANSLALKMAGITNYTEDPVGGSVMKNCNGEPTGLLIDSAMQLLVPLIPKDSLEERRDALIRASKVALKKGVTTVVDFGRYLPDASVEPPWEDFSDVYQWADTRGEMLIRVCLFFPLETWSRLHPYMDEPLNYGLQVTEQDILSNMTMAADRSGLQVAIHAIGDRANDLILDLYDSVASSNGVKDRRFRIEHAQHLAPGGAARFGKQNIIASVQPEHMLDDADVAEKKLGVERAQRESYLFQSLLTSNALLAFGSDWPVANINPLGGIRAAMKRIPHGWKDAWIPSERITVTDALNACTISAAHACFLDEYLGSLSPGKLADFVILSSVSWDDFATEASASVEATYVSGVQAYP